MVCEYRNKLHLEFLYTSIPTQNGATFPILSKLVSRKRGKSKLKSVTEIIQEIRYILLQHTDGMTQ